MSAVSWTAGGTRQAAVRSERVSRTGRTDSGGHAARRGDHLPGLPVNDDFAGYPDFLVRVAPPSDLGAWSYEPWDTKLARHPKPYFLVQLCCYAEMLERAQGVRPPCCGWLLVQLDISLRAREFRTDDFFYYYRALKDAFLDQQRAFDPGSNPRSLRWRTLAAGRGMPNGSLSPGTTWRWSQTSASARSRSSGPRVSRLSPG